MSERVLTVGGNKATRPIEDFMIGIAGNEYYVGPNATGAGDDGRAGKSKETSLATLAKALTLTTASKNDIIYLLPGHAETLATAGAITWGSMIGVRVVGLGVGALRPTFTFSATAATMTMTAASASIENVIIKPSIDAVVSPIVVSAADCKIDVEIQDATYEIECESGILTTAAADRIDIKLKYRGFIAGNACATPIKLVGVDTGRIDVDFYGKVLTAIVNFSGTACHDIDISGKFYNDGTSLTKNVVDSATGSTWSCQGWDGNSNANFSGGDNSALATDDVTAIATAVDSVGVQTSTVDSKLVAKTDSVGVQTSAVDSRVIVVDTAADSVGVQTSTVDSNVVAKTDSVGVQVSTADSRVIVADTAIGSVGVQTSAADSKLIIADAAVDSVGVQTSTTDSRLIVADSAVDSVGIQTSTADSRLIVADSAVDSVGVQVSTVDSRLTLIAHGDVKSVASITTANLFTVAGGVVKVLNIVGYITTACQASGNATKLVMTPTGGTATDLCATLDVTAAGQYGLLSITGTFANAMVLTATAGVKADVQAAAFLTSPGVISMNCAATTTGAIDWYIEYIPLDTDATIVAV